MTTLEPVNNTEQREAKPGKVESPSAGQTKGVKPWSFKRLYTFCLFFYILIPVSHTEPHQHGRTLRPGGVALGIQIVNPSGVAS